MKCAKCGLDLPASTRQCPKCGLVNEVEQAPAAAKKKNPILFVLIGLAVVGLLALGIYAMSSRNVASTPGGVERNDTNITTAPPGKPGPGGLVTAPPGSAEPAKTPEGVARPKPPAEVVEYLNFVKAVEEVRCEIIVKSDLDKELLAEMSQVTAKMFDIAGDADAPDKAPLEGITDKLNRKAAAMLILLQTYDKAPAPVPCREFSGSYRKLLFAETKTIYGIAAGLGKVNASSNDEWQRYAAAAKDKQQDVDVQGASNGTLANESDASLTRLVSNYEMQKPFSVSPEEPKGSLLGL